MNKTSHIGLGLIGGAGLIALSYVNPVTGIVTLVVSLLLAIAVFVLGQSSPLWFRIMFVAVIVDLGFSSCLAGRTMEPGFSFYTFSMALLTFGIFTLVPAFALFRAWAMKVSVPLFAGFFPVSLAIASFVASYEEHKFITDHPDGVGVTARWTVPHHWLAYDAESGELTGSD